MDIETRERIERLRALEDDCGVSGLDVIDVFVGNELHYKRGDKFRDYLIDLLERSDPDEWTDEQLREYGLVRLPRDRDGEFIRIEDDVFDDDGRPCVVTGVWVTGDGISLVTCAGDGRDANRAPQTLTHHPPVTVESVLREFADVVLQDLAKAGRKNGMSYNDWINSSNDAITEYATKLRLADAVE